MLSKVVELSDQAVSSDLRPERNEDINVFLEAYGQLGEAEMTLKDEEVA